MAKAGAKTRVVANAKRLKLLKMIILAANVGCLISEERHYLFYYSCFANDIFPALSAYINEQSCAPGGACNCEANSAKAKLFIVVLGGLCCNLGHLHRLLRKLGRHGRCVGCIRSLCGRSGSPNMS